MHLWIQNVSAYLEEGKSEQVAIEIKNGRIVAVHKADIHQTRISIPLGAEVLDGGGRNLIPGFVDIHVHGGGGNDVMSGDLKELGQMARFHASKGTTSLLATTLTAGVDSIVRVVSAVSAYIKRDPSGGARIAGVHLEGPFLNPAYCGAQNPANMRMPDENEFDIMLAGTQGVVRLITLAPELPGAERVIAKARELGITVSAGHTGATYDEMKRAIGWGVSHATHLFNGMKGIHHRDPGAAGGALLHPDVTVELICDGIHVHPDLIRMVFDLKSSDRVAFITDCVSCAGCSDGDGYHLGELPVILRDGQVRLRTENGQPGGLAGSTLTMRKAWINALACTGRTPEELLPAFTLTPARQAGLEKEIGSIAPGKLADLVLMDEKWQVVWTMVGGRIVYQRDAG